VCFLIICAGIQAQEAQENSREYKPREQKLYFDIPLTIGEITLINLAGNGAWRLWGPDKESAYFTLDSMATNFNPHVWTHEEGLGGDNFLTNQFFHAYAGGMYFASARSNNLNFYYSMLFSTFGSLQWEILGESESPATNDLITTAFGGITVGEILYRLYVEFNKGGVGGKIGSTLLSPTGRITDAIRGYGPDESPSKIKRSSLVIGFSCINAGFFEDNEKTGSWSRPGGFLFQEIIYGDPFTARSKTPYDQFDLNLTLTFGFPIVYNFTVITDGYLASWLLEDNLTDQASNGITLNFDHYVTNEGTFIDLNTGRDNHNFSAHSLDYSIKWRHVMSSSWEFSLKTHLGFTPWSVANYNGGVDKDDYNLYLLGFNVKLFLELRQMKDNSPMKNGHALAMSLCFYDGWKISKTPGPESNTQYLHSKIAYSFPISDRFSIYLADTFMFLHIGLTDKSKEYFPDLTRWLNISQAGIKIIF